MNHILRLAVASGLLVGLSGCNNVVSIEPWFTAEDAKGAPELREGLWVMLADDSCRVDLEKPAERWPDCANSIYVRGREWWAMRWDEADGDGGGRVFEEWDNIPTIIAAGDPAILQIEDESEPLATASESDVIVIDDGEPNWRYNYSAIHPTELDSQNRVVAFELWSIACGPLPEQEASESNGVGGDPNTPRAANNVTKQPFPGLTVVGNNCTAESTGAIRRAAVSSRSIGHPMAVHWVRDGWR